MLYLQNYLYFKSKQQSKQVTSSDLVKYAGKVCLKVFVVGTTQKFIRVGISISEENDSTKNLKKIMKTLKI